MSVTEALELGLPVVAYDLPAMLPLVRDGEEGRIVPCFNNKKFAMAMEELAGSDEMRRIWSILLALLILAAPVRPAEDQNQDILILLSQLIPVKVDISVKDV